MSLFKFGFTTAQTKKSQEASTRRSETEEEKEEGIGSIRVHTHTPEAAEASESATTSEQPGPSDVTDILDTQGARRHIPATYVTDLGSKEDGPRQPALESYPQTKLGAKNRCFNKHWYSRFPWLEYSITKNAAFCYSCRVFPSATGHMESNFTEKGVNQWKKAIEKFQKHSESESHKNSYSRWQHFIQSLSEGSIASKISSHHSREVEENWKYMEMISKLIIFLSRQGLALRGDDESQESLNKGNFLELCSLIAEIDQNFCKKYAKMPLNATYQSPEIQNEIIHTTAELIRAQIAKEVNTSGMATIIVDESKDSSKKEQISICVRYVEFKEGAYALHEEFLDFQEANNLDAKSLSEQIMQEMMKLGLRNTNIVGQCYDGASVMSGHLSGVQARIQEHFPDAYYVHCHAHRLNLVLVDICKNINSASQFFVLLEAIYVFITRSLVHKIFVEFQQRDKIRVKELVRLSDTRWACRYHSLDTLKSRYSYIVEVLEYFTDPQPQSPKRDPKLVIEARGLFDQVSNVSFITHLEVLLTLLSHSQTLSETLQASDANLGNCVAMINSVISIFDVKRESGWPDMWKNIERMCSENDISLLPQTKRRRKQRTFDDSFVMSSTGQSTTPATDMQTNLRINVFLPILDAFKSEMTRRFSTTNLTIMKGVDALLSSASSNSNFLNFDNVKPFVELYVNTVNIDLVLLSAELAIARQILADQDAAISVNKDFTEVQKIIPYSNLPNLQKATRLALTLPVSSAVCERSFSAMKYIKNYLRSTMSNQRLSDLGVIYVCGQRSKRLLQSPGEVVEHFSKREKRTKIKLF